jgi:hypothetical protein
MKQSFWNRAASACTALRRMMYERLFFGIAVVSLLSFADPALFILGNPAVGAVLSAQDLTPRVDTLWTKLTTQTPWVDFTACAMGGNPRGFIVATVRREEPQDKYLVEYDVETGAELRNVRSGHYGDAQYMTFARNANVFATAEAGLIKVWRWPELEVIREFTGDSRYRPAVLLTSDGKRLFYAQEGVMYDVATGDTVWSWKSNRVFPMPKITPDDRFLLVYNCDKLDPPWGTCLSRASLLDAATGTELASFSGGSGEEVIAAMAISDDGRYVAVSRLVDSSPQTDGSLVVYDRETRTEVLYRTLGVLEGGAELVFTPGNTGILVARSILSEYWGWQYYPAWRSEPVHEFAWTGHSFSNDWTLNYGCKSSMVGVSRFNLTTVSVQSSTPDVPPTLYPNPTDGTITVRLPGVADGPLRYELVQTTGQMVSSGFTTLVTGVCIITPTPALAQGSYALRLLRGTGMVFSSPLVVR